MRRLMSVMALLLVAGCATTPPRKYVVFFSSGSTALDDSAQTVVSEAASLAKTYPNRHIIVEGYARANGDLTDESALAADRAKTVAQQLMMDGIVADRIEQKPRTPSNAEGTVGSRRVEIEIVSP